MNFYFSYFIDISVRLITVKNVLLFKRQEERERERESDRDMGQVPATLLQIRHTNFLSGVWIVPDRSA